MTVAESGRFGGLRYRLLALVLVPLLLLSGTVILLAFNWSSNYTYEQLFTKVNTDLRVARDGFSSIQINGQRELYSLANSVELATSLRQQHTPTILAILQHRQHQGGFDFLKLLSADGQSVLLESGWQPHRLKRSPSTELVLLGTEVVAQPNDVISAIEIYSADDWSNEPNIQADKVLLPLIDTARAAPSQRTIEDRAMVIRTLQPVVDSQGRAIALLEGGLLLNRNFQFVDRIRDLVYGPGSLAPGSRGTVTVFLEDVRITTNVPSLDDSRALGTRVSQEVRNAVLTRGESWVNRAFVVNDWYISAYEPIVDVFGTRVGMLYAGYLEAPFRQDLFKAIAGLSVLVVAGSLLAGVAATIGARAIFSPIESIASVVRATARGEHRRIGPLSTGDEIGELASQFDAMLDTLESHRERIEKDAMQLEEKVQMRTFELEQQNRRLQDSINLLHQTRQQLAIAEKLAALGELTAGVAHEINNPTAVILGNMDVLVAELGHACEPAQTEINLIFEQVYRIRSITDRLLQYSRTAEHNVNSTIELAPGAQTPTHNGVQEPSNSIQNSAHTVPIEELVNDTLKLLSHEFNGSLIHVNQRHIGDVAAFIDRQELQQVFINLLSNAIAAIDIDGHIDIHSRLNDDGHAQIVFADNGCGIEKHNLPRVFDPFFTSGKVAGTGLGLSVSYGIVRRFGGDISVRSELGKGSEFTVLLPAATVNKPILTMNLS